MAARYLPTNYVAMKLLNSCIILVQFLIATGGPPAKTFWLRLQGVPPISAGLTEQYSKVQDLLGRPVSPG